MEENVEQTYSILSTCSYFPCAGADEINALRSFNSSISATNSALGVGSADVECKWLMPSICAAVPPMLPTLLTNELGPRAVLKLKKLPCWKTGLVFPRRFLEF